MGYVSRILTPFRIIIISFAGIILLGALILMLPVSSADGASTPFGDALFTATSAVCVTGLVVRDTASHWSLFGRAVILILIQTGGLGIVTVAASFSLLSGRKISLVQRSTMQKAISAQKVGGIVDLTKFVIISTFVIELAGALLLMPFFIKSYGAKGIGMAVFHSVSAFCNAGFDVMGSSTGEFSSLTSFTGNVGVNVIVMLLIFVGGIGFLTWDDVITNKLKFKHYRLQSKVVLVTSLLLIVFPALIFFFYDLKGLPLNERILSSLFQSVTTRTAGFNTVNLNTMTAAGQSIMIVLMLIGGSPGSTAGGMKTTTIAVLIANAHSCFRQQEDAHCFKRRIDNDAVRTASTLLLMYTVLCFGSASVISISEGIPFYQCLFETASAIGTVGLTLGITTQLGGLAQGILIVLMFIGRVGGLTLIYAALKKERNTNSKLPLEKITVG
ncbi:MAG: Trk family potassium uptake protein [Eubacterium sp.]|nr:Trk family potassium uptake protein [Eubacterium sp.]